MKRFIKIFAVAFVAVATLSSCAQKVDEDWDALVDYTFDLWMSMNHPELEKNEYGIYVEEIVSVENGTSPLEEYWVDINYTGYLISGSVYVTRDEQVARDIGTFEYTTHFTPHFTYMSEYLMTWGQMYSLMEMKEGERRMLYIPPSMAYGTSLAATFATGYAGTVSVHTDAPLILDIELVGVTSDAEAYQANLLERYAASNWGIPINDTIKTGLYADIVSSVEGSATVAEDSIVYMYYKGMFLDDFVFDTNIQELAEELGLYTYLESDYIPLDYQPAAGGLIEGVYEAFVSDEIDIKYNDVVRVAFISDYGYGYYGSTEGSTEIQPYAPLVFEMQLLPYMGFETRPYTVYHVLNNLSDTDADPKTDVFVRGYVIGCIDGNEISESTAQLTEDEFTVTTNLLISASNDDTNLDNCIVVDISSNPTLQAKYNLVDNPLRYETRISFYGDLETVKGRIGVANLEEY